MTMRVLGRLDHVDRTRLEGWAFDPARPDQPVELELLDNDAPVLRFRAEQHRADLAAAGFADGRCAFSVSIPAGWSPLVRHRLRVCRVRDGLELEGSPVTLPPACDLLSGAAPGAESLAAALQLLGERGTQDEREAVLRLLLGAADTLLRAGIADGGAPPAAEMAAFCARWGRLLPEPPPLPLRADEPPARPRSRALVVVATVADCAQPHMRALLRGLQRRGQEVTLVCSEPHPAADVAAALGMAEVICDGLPFMATLEEGVRRQAGLFDSVLLHPLATALRHAAMLRQHLPRARLAVCVASLERAALQARAAAEQLAVPAALLARLRTEEAIAIWSVDAALACSTEVLSALRETAPAAPLYLLREPDAAVADLLGEALPLR